MLREALKKMGREDLIGNSKKHLVPAWQPIVPANKTNGSRNPAGAKARANPRANARTRKPEAVSKRSGRSH
jgi:hypothetical protein